MSELSQDNRPGALTTPLPDVLVLVRCDVQEGLSNLFEIRVEAISTKRDINFDQAIGQQCSVKIKTYKNEVREFHGILAEAEYHGTVQQMQWLEIDQELYGYHLVLRPWLWILSHRSNCRIFEKKTVPDIIKKVFEGFDYKIQVKGSFPEREYCVQYRETDFNFVCRLMEEEGIYYFFKHEGGKHTLVLMNEKSSHESVPNHDTTPFRPPTGQLVTEEQSIQDWTSIRRFRTGKIELMDYNDEKSREQMRSQAKGTEKYAHSDMEIYDYPGNYKEKSIGERYAKIELEAQQAHDHRRHGNGDAISLFPGGLTKLKGHPAGDSQDKQYLIVRAMHSFAEQSYRSGDGPGASYNGHYEFLPADQQFRAPIVTPKPRIHGIQTAFVTGAAGEEIDVDKFGRIVVQFHWDRQGKRDENSSCRIRVAEVWSGKKWGGQFIPRVGQEVVVEFLDGNPDRPLVVGTVYNDEYKHPFDMPGQKTMSGLKSDKTKGSKGYNEWSFEDKANSEKITMHAEKDHDVTVKHAETWKIGETFEAPTGMPSRKVEIQKGDDDLKISTGSRKVDTAMMDQLKAGVMIKLECGASKITILPGMLMIESPMIIINGALVMIN